MILKRLIKNKINKPIIVLFISLTTGVIYAITPMNLMTHRLWEINNLTAQSRTAHFESIRKCIKASGLVTHEGKTIISEIKTHSLFTKLLKWKHLYDFKDIDTLPKGEVFSITFDCISNQKTEDFQVWYFDDLNKAKSEFIRFEELVNVNSIFEKPYKQFFRKDNMIFYITMTNWNNNDSCSFILIEYLSKELYGYDVDYSSIRYASGKKRNMLSFEKN